MNVSVHTCVRVRGRAPPGVRVLPQTRHQLRPFSQGGRMWPREASVPSDSAHGCPGREGGRGGWTRGRSPCHTRDAPLADSHLAQVRVTCQGEGPGLPSPKLCYANRGGQAETVAVGSGGGGPQGLASKVSWNAVCVWGSLFSKVVTVTGAQEPRRLWAPRSEPPAPSGTALPGSARLGA